MSEIKNRINDLTKYYKENPYPDITKSVFEIHVFFAPVNPDQQTIDKYVEVTKEINNDRANSGKNQTKACLLALEFRDAGYVTVMQSSRYYHTDSMEKAIAECNYEADCYLEKFKKHGVKIDVIREKLETLASSNGVPKTDNDSLLYPKYFEFHIRVAKKSNTNNDPISDVELQELEDISKKFTKQFDTPVPLSYNKLNEQQRYLNVRFRKIGSESARSQVDQIVQAINASENFVWVKTIAEYVPYDSFPELDIGWID